MWCLIVFSKFFTSVNHIFILKFVILKIWLTFIYSLPKKLNTDLHLETFLLGIFLGQIRSGFLLPETLLSKGIIIPNSSVAWGKAFRICCLWVYSMWEFKNETSFKYYISQLVIYSKLNCVTSSNDEMYIVNIYN